MAPGVARAWKLVKGGGVTGSASKSRDDHPGVPSRRWEGVWRGRYFSSTHAPFCAQELASFGGRSIKNATGRIGYDRVSVNSRGEMRVSPLLSFGC